MHQKHTPSTDYQQQARRTRSLAHPAVVQSVATAAPPAQLNPTLQIEPAARLAPLGHALPAAAVHGAAPAKPPVQNAPAMHAMQDVFCHAGGQ
jgi:hypothetical protein